MKISVVIPALNEEKTIGKVVSNALTHDAVSEVIVVNNNSTDATEQEAIKNGACVVLCENKGLGYAMKVGISAAREDYILKTDGDIDNWSSNWVSSLLPKNGKSLQRGIYQSPYNQLPVTKLVVLPLLKIFRPRWADVPMPITGTYLFGKNCIDMAFLSNDWSFDISLLFYALENNINVRNIDIGTLSDRQRPISHYEPMALEIQKFMLNYFVGVDFPHEH